VDIESFAPEGAATAIVSPTRSCEPLAQQRRGMAWGRIDPGVSACAGHADGVGTGARLPLRFNTECTEIPRRITERRAMKTAVIAWNQVRPGWAWAGLGATSKLRTMKANSVNVIAARAMISDGCHIGCCTMAAMTVQKESDIPAFDRILLVRPLVLQGR
jgi:hypothetical protein